jgi:uncharacterized protein YjiS (DUF1127 family)
MALTATFPDEMIMSRTTFNADFASAPVAAPAVHGLVGRIAAALSVRRERRALMALDDRMLADVGLSRADAYREAHRPFLDVPADITAMARR